MCTACCGTSVLSYPVSLLSSQPLRVCCEAFLTRGSLLVLGTVSMGQKCVSSRDVDRMWLASAVSFGGCGVAAAVIWGGIKLWLMQVVLDSDLSVFVCKHSFLATISRLPYHGMFNWWGPTIIILRAQWLCIVRRAGTDNVYGQSACCEMHGRAPCFYLHCLCLYLRGLK